MQETLSDRGVQFPTQTPACSVRQTGRGRTQPLRMSVYYFPVGALRSLKQSRFPEWSLQWFPFMTKNIEFIIGIILSKHVLGCEGEKGNNLNIFNIPKLSKVWWPGTLVVVVFQMAAKRLILIDVWGVGV